MKKFAQILNKNMKISFIIPAYNEEKYIGKCLESLFKEIDRVRMSAKKGFSSGENFEVIVVNNASTDQTKEIASSFSEVKVIDEFKKGLMQARHAGFLHSTGDLIANIDADVVIPERWIDKALYEFRNYPELVGFSGPFIYYDISEFRQFLVKIYYFIGYITHLFNHFILRKGALMQGGNYVVRRDALEKIGGYNLEIDFYGEDVDVARRIQKVGRVKFDFNFPMYTSGRRLKGEGFFYSGIKYPINYIWVMIFKKPYSKKYSDIRFKN
jgi:glycosyltransferase involved in cell wall biosynthesis